jgi:hypothetical protein
MTTPSTAERQVTEFVWPSGHRGWTIRCGDCPEQAEVSNRNLPKLAEWVEGKSWAEFDGVHVLPLSVLSRRMRDLNG